MTAPPCPCGQPVADNARVCSPCTRELEKALAEIPALAHELDTAVTRQARLDRGTFTGLLQPALTEQEKIELEDAVASVHIQALPYDPQASEERFILRDTLHAWALVITTERGQPHPLRTLEHLSQVLLSSLEWLRHHPDAEAAFDELLHASRHAWTVVDRRPDRIYAGPCDSTGTHHQGEEWDQDLTGVCPTDLYAHPGRDTVSCPRCQLVWDVAGRRDYLLEAAHDQLVTAADLSRFLTVYGEPVKGERIRKWAERGRITAHGHNARQQPLYRVGDAVALLADMAERNVA